VARRHPPHGADAVRTGFIFTFVHGGLTGLFLGNVTVDVPLSDTYFVIGHFHMVMGVSPVMVLFGAIYHWFPKMTGRMLERHARQIHFWMTFLGTYAIYLPMHYLGILGMPRRYYAYGDTEVMPASACTTNQGITIAAIIVAAAQMIFLVNVVYSLTERQESRSRTRGARRRSSGRRPDTPPKHGNWGPKLPVVYRWAYDYSVPGADRTSSRRTSRRKPGRR
jgi:cytochrome c oxidase subunit I